MEKKYKLMKVFDCIDMPKDVRNALVEQYYGHSNDSAIEYYCYPERKAISGPPNPYGESVEFEYDTYNGGEIIYDVVEEGVRYIVEKGDDIVLDWLHDNGVEIFEKVIIKYWW